MNVKTLRVWYSTLPCWRYDQGPDTEPSSADHIILLTSCHTEIRTTNGMTQGWFQAFDVDIEFDDTTKTLTVRESAKCTT